MVNKTSVCLVQQMCSPSKWLPLTHALLYFVYVFPSGFFLLVCFSFCLRHVQSLSVLFSFHFHYLFISCFQLYLFSIRSVFCYVYEHKYFVFSYSVCTHLPLIYFTNTLILFHDVSLSCFQMQQFLHGFQNENKLSSLSLAYCKLISSVVNNITNS
jgi:hypothetical protein